MVSPPALPTCRKTMLEMLGKVRTWTAAVVAVDATVTVAFVELEPTGGLSWLKWVDFVDDCIHGTR